LAVSSGAFQNLTSVSLATNSAEGNSSDSFLRSLITRANLKLASPRLRLIKAGTEVAPGVTTIDTAGHTPGHMSVHISSGSEELLLTADAVVNSTVSFQHPEWPFGFDQDVPLATKTRLLFLLFFLAKCSISLSKRVRELAYLSQQICQVYDAMRRGLVQVAATTAMIPLRYI
jgi:hypothetical protein